MELVRFAVLVIESGKQQDTWQSFALQEEEVEVASVSSWEKDKNTEVLVGALVPLHSLPDVDRLGFVEVPDEPRRHAEGAIERAADHISVLTGARCQLWSPRLPVAFRGAVPGELESLRDSKGVIDGEYFVPADFFSMELEPSYLSALSGREDGVALLAGAVGTTNLATAYREILRVFERAFASSSSRLVISLSEFLAARPALEFSKTEVKNWVEKMRGSAVHADRQRPLLSAADFRPVVNRMRFAAYDVLLNKSHWHGSGPERRAIWEPTYGPRNAGGVIAVQGEAGQFGMEMLDRFSAFKMRSDSANFELGDEFWPQTGPTSMKGKPQIVQVVSAAAFSVEPPRPESQSDAV